MGDLSIEPKALQAYYKHNNKIYQNACFSDSLENQKLSPISVPPGFAPAAIEQREAFMRFVEFCRACSVSLRVRSLARAPETRGPCLSFCPLLIAIDLLKPFEGQIALCRHFRLVSLGSDMWSSDRLPACRDCRPARKSRSSPLGHPPDPLSASETMWNQRSKALKYPKIMCPDVSWPLPWPRSARLPRSSLTWTAAPANSENCKEEVVDRADTP